MTEDKDKDKDKGGSGGEGNGGTAAKEAPEEFKKKIKDAIDKKLGDQKGGGRGKS